MTDRRYDPEGYAEIERAKLATAIEEFQTRSISDDVFMAYLKARGFYGYGLSEEFRYQDALRYHHESLVKRNGVRL